MHSQLPDFMMALEKLELSSPRQTATGLPTSPRTTRSPLATSPSQQPLSTSSSYSPAPARHATQKLRYTAYDAPQPVQKMRRQGNETPRGPTSGGGTPRSPRSPRSALISEQGIAALERTLVPEELAVADGGNVMELKTFAEERSPVPQPAPLLQHELEPVRFQPLHYVEGAT
jgi:hypothetical protein